MICACHILEPKHGPVHLDTKLLMHGGHGYLKDKLPGMLCIFHKAQIWNHIWDDMMRDFCFRNKESKCNNYNSITHISALKLKIDKSFVSAGI